jgi:hypothetical protein
MRPVYSTKFTVYRPLQLTYFRKKLVVSVVVIFEEAERSEGGGEKQYTTGGGYFYCLLHGVGHVFGEIAIYELRKDFFAAGAGEEYDACDVALYACRCLCHSRPR